jgi:hypothetical protein
MQGTYAGCSCAGGVAAAPRGRRRSACLPRAQRGVGLELQGARFRCWASALQSGGPVCN